MIRNGRAEVKSIYSQPRRKESEVHEVALQESGEMYLESIYVLSKNAEGVHAIDVCEHMGYSKPSVSRAMSILKRDGYITVDADLHIHLTEMGLEVARGIFERHTVLTDFLVSLGVEPEKASSDACKIEHVISEQAMVKIREYLENKN
jgi:Mn-dependent DtxR family transcriptional regulator